MRAAKHMPPDPRLRNLHPGLMVLEPGPPLAPPRDYRKELWIAVVASTVAESPTVCIGFADKALELFDRRFPK